MTGLHYDAKVRLVIRNGRDLHSRYGNHFSSGAMFLPSPDPAEVGKQLLLEFAMPDGRLVCRVLAEVIHAKEGIVANDQTSGMGLRFLKLDPAAARIATHFRKLAPPPRLHQAADPQHRQLPGPVVGIDLGTINSCVAFVKDGTPTVLTNHRGYETVPSVVHFDESGEPAAVGHIALERMILAPFHAVYGSKRFLGRGFRTAEVQALGHFFHYSLVEGPGGHAMAEIAQRTVPLEAVSAEVLRELASIASDALGEPVRRAVVTVPAYFGESQRAATVEAGRIAGIQIERLINEPTAAAIAFGMLKPGTRATVLAYDLGGGTFDASLMRIDGTKMQVLASEGDPFLGGTDFDDRLIQFVLTGVEREHGVDLRSDPVAVQRIRFAVESAKRQLSEASEARVTVPFVAEKNDRRIDIDFGIPREMFISLTRDLVDRTLQIVQRVLDSAKVRTEQIDELILVGGQSRSPHVAQALRERFGKSPNKRVHPDHAVAIGASIVADRVFGSIVPVQAPPRAPAEPTSQLPAPEPEPNLEAMVVADEDLEEIEEEGSGRFDLTEIVTGSLHAVLPDGSMRTLFPRRTPLPAKRDIFLPPTQRSATEFILILVRGEKDTAEQNEPVCSVRLPQDMSRDLSGNKARIWVSVHVDGQLEVVAENPMTGETAPLAVPIR